MEAQSKIWFEERLRTLPESGSGELKTKTNNEMPEQRRNKDIRDNQEKERIHLH